LLSSTPLPTGSRSDSMSPMALPRSVGDDRGAGDVPLVLLDEGLLDRFQRELVGDDLVPRVAVPRAGHHIEGPAQVLGLVVREAEDAAVAEDDPGRIELGLPAH